MSWMQRSASIIMPPRRAGLTCDTVDGEHILSNPEQGTAVFLNETAALVWEHCDGRTMTRDVATLIAERYEVSIDRALDDVEELLEGFAGTGMLELDEPES
jgi:hypothetical protein